MVKRLKQLSLYTLSDIYDSATDGFAAFAPEESDPKLLTEQIDFGDLRLLKPMDRADLGRSPGRRLISADKISG